LQKQGGTPSAESYTDSILENPEDGYRKMWEWINETLYTFRSAFNREAPFRWFVIVVIAFMIRTDHLGVTAFIRELSIAPKYYETLLHFFRAKSWNLENIRQQWMRIVAHCGILFREDTRPILVGDGVKQGKEGKKMPCVKKLFQESENSSKAPYIYGHMFGALGVLIGNGAKLFCTPISMTIQDGDKRIRHWLDSNATQDSHVVRIIRQACYAAKLFGSSILLLDRYFLTVPALRAWLEEEKLANCQLTIVTKAKSNAVAYEKPAVKSGRGRPPKKGRAVKLSNLFDSFAPEFTQTVVKMYGETESISYLCKDLLWGKGLYCQLRFVLVKYGNTQSILVCTNAKLTPEQIIRLYSYRFKIESCFREFKQVMAGLAYHFWSKAMPKLNRFAKWVEPLDAVRDDKDKSLIVSTFTAIERFVMMACIAMGLLQICSLRFSHTINASSMRWLRTQSNKIPSEATTADFLRKSFFRMFHLLPDLPIFRLIQCVQSETKQSRDPDSLIAS